MGAIIETNLGELKKYIKNLPEDNALAVWLNAQITPESSISCYLLLGTKYYIVTKTVQFAGEDEASVKCMQIAVKRQIEQVELPDDLSKLKFKPPFSFVDISTAFATDDPDQFVLAVALEAFPEGNVPT